MEVRRLQPAEAALGVEAIRLLKAPDGYPTPSTEYFEQFLSKPENVFIVAVDPQPIGFAVVTSSTGSIAINACCSSTKSVWPRLVVVRASAPVSSRS